MLYIAYKLNQKSYNHKLKTGKLKNNEIRQCVWCKKFYVPQQQKDYNKYFCSNRCNKKFNLEKNQKFKHNNICDIHKSQKLSFKNMCWDCYKIDFYKNLKNIKKQISFLVKLKMWIHGFELYPTFRTSKESWNGDKIAFEQNLIDNNIKWFIYIKFYEQNKNNFKPLVIGKSGSLKANPSGSDLNFSTNVKDGLARQLLFKENKTWSYDFIYIKKCFTEKDAYKKESKFMKKFDLYGS